MGKFSFPNLRFVESQLRLQSWSPREVPPHRKHATREHACRKLCTSWVIGPTYGAPIDVEPGQPALRHRRQKYLSVVATIALAGQGGNGIKLFINLVDDARKHLASSNLHEEVTR
jgi:hypothetical protein